MTKSEFKWQRIVANGLIAVGAGAIGGGIYGVLLYKLELVWFGVAIIGGLFMLGLGLMLGEKIPKRQA